MPLGKLLTVLIGASSIAGAQAHSGTAAVGRAAQKQIPFLFEDERIYVPVRIGTSAPRWFILDTGASSTILDTSVARAEHLRVEGNETIKGAGSGSSDEEQGSSVELKLGGVPLHIMSPAVLDLAHLLGPTSGRAPAGIIGSEFFREHFVDIDFAARRIVVDPAEAARRRLYSAWVPLTFVEQTPLTHVVLKLKAGHRVEANALVDLGAKSTFLIPDPFIAREKLRESAGPTLVTGFGAGVGGDTFYAFARAARLSFAAAPALGVDRPVIGLSVGGTLRSTWNEGLLGAQFLSSFRIGFDYRHKRLFLGRAEVRPREFDRSGLFLVAAGDSLRRIIVRQVLKDGPGEQAGLLPEDEIIAIDGESVGKAGLAGLRQMLRRPGSGILTVTYRRGADEHEAKLQLRDLL